MPASNLARQHFISKFILHGDGLKASALQLIPNVQKMGNSSRNMLQSREGWEYVNILKQVRAQYNTSACLCCWIPLTL